MPESRNRRKHHQHVHPQPGPSHISHSKVKRSAAFVVAVVAAILGLAVAYFTQGADFLWMFTGVVAGAIIGYLVGRSMDKSIEKKQH